MKKIFLSFCLLFILAFSFALPALAQSYGLNETAGSVEAYKNQKNITYDKDFLAGKVGDIIGMVLSFVGVIFLVIIIYSGILWMTSMGNDQKVEKAKDMVINATIGLIIVFAAYAVTAFIGGQLTK